MKRQIKFRGKRVDTGEWVFGYYLEFSLCDGEGRCSYIKVDGCQPIKVDPDTVGQFTGLLDKNEKEIYEGDIIKSHGQNRDYIQVVEFHNTEITSGRGWVGVNHVELDRITKKITVVERFSYFSLPCSCEVISSIHDNPELLKGGKA